MSGRVNQIVWVTLVVGVALGGYTIRRRAAAQIPQVTYETVSSDVGDVIAKVTASGTVSALVSVQVGSQVSGRVLELLADFNSPVRKGDVIARLDPLLFQAAFDQSRANLLTAESTLKTAEAQARNAARQYERAKTLLSRQLMARSEFDTVESNYEVAAAQVEAARSSLEVTRATAHQAEVNLGYTTITSPIDGTVISRNIDVGQTVASAFQAPTLFLIAQDLRRMQVDTSVSEADVGRLKTGMAATFTVDAYPGEAFSGHVRQIRSAPTTVQNIVTYDAVIDVDNAGLKLKPGMTANVSFVVAERPRVVRLPNVALRFQPDEKILQQIGVDASATEGALPSKVVWVLRENRPVAEPIDVGISDGTETELARGNIRGGETLITDMALVPARRFGLF